MFIETDHPFPPVAPAPRCLPGGATLAVLAIRDNLQRAMQNLDDCDDNRARRRMNRQAVVSCELLPHGWVSIVAAIQSASRNRMRSAPPKISDVFPTLVEHCDDCQRDVADCACYQQDPLYTLLDSCDL